ncbi:STX12-like protein [Mya arenaria]|uniref:STX12-like protein n=1 Tax=Mya arenaria TaxID=6604 RepID=A0ABY7FNU1_MYAAR|nr:STX12-like protein [Mya arenaria]
MASYERGGFDQSTSYQGSSASNDPNTLMQRIGGNVQKISQNVSQLERLVRQIGTPQDSEEVRDRVHEITHSTNQLAKDTNKDMQTLAHLPPQYSQQQRQIKLQKERLTEQFSDVLKNFQTVQRTAAEKERASISRARAASSNSYVSKKGPLIDFGSGFGEDTTENQFTEPGYSKTAQVLQMENDVDIGAIREREGAIKQLESDIMDVNQIFKDLGMLVHEQGEALVEGTKKEMLFDYCVVSVPHPEEALHPVRVPVSHTSHHHPDHLPGDQVTTTPWQPAGPCPRAQGRRAPGDKITPPTTLNSIYLCPKVKYTLNHVTILLVIYL